MREIDDIKKLMQSTLELKKKYELEISKIRRKISNELAKSSKHLKVAWPALRPNLLIVILRDEQYRIHHNQWMDIPFIDGSYVTLMKKNSSRIPDISLKPDSASAKTVFRFSKGNSREYSREYISFSAAFFRDMREKNLIETLDVFNLIYEESFKRAEALKKTKNKNPYTMEEYFKVMKRLRVLDFIDDIEIWRGASGIADYPEEKFRKEIQIEKDRETANQAIKMLKR